VKAVVGRLTHYRLGALSLGWFVFFSGRILLFLPPLIRILTLVALLTALMAGLIALLLLAPVALVSSVFLLLIALILLLSVHLKLPPWVRIRRENSVAWMSPIVTVS
jgi:hypothetical protein